MQAIAATIGIQVTNAGVEIPAASLAQMVDTFYRVPNSDPWKYGGTGLGLALVKKLVAHWQGRIQVTSANQTTTFTVFLNAGTSPESSLGYCKASSNRCCSHSVWYKPG